MSEHAAHVTVTENGPYLVSGTVPLSIERMATDGEDVWEFAPVRTFDAQAKYALCRCGESNTKPFCDGTHKQIGFDGTETASRAPFAEQAKRYEGPALDLDDAEALCSFARFCDGRGSIWGNVERDDEPEGAAVVRHEGTRCPSGRLVVRERGGAAVETRYDAAAVLLEDPQKNCSGPIALRGGITLTAADGETYERRNRVALCRCGKSSNKPFCDGTHADSGFVDGLT